MVGQAYTLGENLLTTSTICIRLDHQAATEEDFAMGE